ncbi:iron-sulfur cluster assembly scaffold protein, partial [bacterium]|nr:iron-sulfur cluster assembly scaffold protein [bacterium]
MSTGMDDLYREVILDHHRRPRGARALAHPDAEAAGKNPSCGDELTLQLACDGDRIREACVVTRGCAIATASGSILAELVVGR